LVACVIADSLSHLSKAELRIYHTFGRSGVSAQAEMRCCLVCSYLFRYGLDLVFYIQDLLQHLKLLTCPTFLHRRPRNQNKIAIESPNKYKKSNPVHTSSGSGSGAVAGRTSRHQEPASPLPLALDEAARGAVACACSATGESLGGREKGSTVRVKGGTVRVKGGAAREKDDTAREKGGAGCRVRRGGGGRARRAGRKAGRPADARRERERAIWGRRGEMSDRGSDPCGRRPVVGQGVFLGQSSSAE
jgi:hypothetical protein